MLLFPFGMTVQSADLSMSTILIVVAIATFTLAVGIGAICCFLERMKKDKENKDKIPKISPRVLMSSSSESDADDEKHPILMNWADGGDGISSKNEEMLIWKGRIFHAEPVEDNENQNEQHFEAEIYRIGGRHIHRLPGFEGVGVSKQHKGDNKNSMLMTGRIEHIELEKYLKRIIQKESRKLICCKISICGELHSSNSKLIEHLNRRKERCARFQVGNKSKKTYFDFYVIPPTKTNTSLNYTFVAEHFATEISNKQMWGVLVLPIESFHRVSRDRKDSHSKHHGHEKADDGDGTDFIHFKE